MTNRNEAESEVVIIKVSGCEECPLKSKSSDHGASWQSCSHPNLKHEGWGGRTIPTLVSTRPEWCPLVDCSVKLEGEDDK